MNDMLQGVGFGVLFGMACAVLIAMFIPTKTLDAPKKNLLTNSQSELVDSICNEAVTITCSDGKTIGVKNGN